MMSLQDTLAGLTQVPIASIRMDGGTQPRANIDGGAVADYMNAMADGADFPPVVVFYDGTSYWLADGFHRIRAAEQAGRDEIACEVHQGTQQDAQWYSFGANKTNGLRRTNQDKKRAVKLPDERYGDLFIFRIFNNISYGLVMQVSDSVQVGDVAKSPE